MIKHQRKITNPMTIIAIFAAISETSAAVSLPFLDDEEREIYIWFLISFPFYLLLLFFVTLNFNYKSLYAPSDFEKSKQFIKVIDEASRTEKEKLKETANGRCRNNRAETKKHTKNSTNTAPSDDVPIHGQSPPEEIALTMNATPQQTLRIAGKLNHLQFIDVRQLRNKKELDHVMTKNRQQRETTHGIIVFITDSKTDRAFNKSTLKSYPRNDRGAKDAYMIYSLRKLTMTVID
ncbi:hypothetical protein [Pseudomonas purpurea]|uniref:hypothetical protein n=1 Tax=Pseudomonas purpurea TaxID=3136737 RepID=UPI00326609BF